MSARKRLFIGQRFRGIPTGTINSLGDDVDRLERQTGRVPGPIPAMGGGLGFLKVRVVNNTGGDLVERAIVGIDTSALTLPEVIPGESEPDENLADETILSGVPVEVVTPNADAHRHKWAITLEPIPQWEDVAMTIPGTGWAVVTGLIECRVDVTDESHQFVVPDTGDTVYAKSASSGAPIWSRGKEADSDSTGKQWALVLLGGGSGGGGGNPIFDFVFLAPHVDPDFTYQIDGATVEVDTDTGEIEVTPGKLEGAYLLPAADSPFTGIKHFNFLGDGSEEVETIDIYNYYGDSYQYPDSSVLTGKCVREDDGSYSLVENSCKWYDVDWGS